jgi:precorrin-3B C17-methyltransferase
LRCYQGPLADEIGPLFATRDQMVFFLSLGAVTRLIAPHLSSKHQDPGVLVVDEGGRFVIPALSGHIGGANAFAERVAALIGAIPVITTASDVQGTLAVDLLGRDLGWRLEAPKLNVTRVSAQVVNGQPIALIQECGSRDWWRRENPLPANIHRFERFEDLDPAAYAGLLWVTRRELSPDLWQRFAGRLVVYRPPAEEDSLATASGATDLGAAVPLVANPPARDSLREIPRGPLPPAGSLILGIGCDRGTALTTLEEAVAGALAQLHQDPSAVAAIATIDQKGDEAAILALAHQGGWPLHLFSAAELAQVPVPNPSATVRARMGTPSVAEAAALLTAARSNPAPSSSPPLAADPGGGPRPPLEPTPAFQSGANPLGAIPSWRAELPGKKYKYRGSDGKHATVAIARAQWAPTGPLAPAPPRPAGKISLVSLGPGALEHMTLRARQAIADAEVVIGYVTYLKLIPDLLVGKEVIRKAMTEELDRSLEAWEQARRGRRVALVSSGDIGVYGMAGPTYEVLLRAGWRPGEGIEVEVIPGCTALAACASLVGAPLTHDFCSISLSDLLTPWPVIARRLEAAAQGDFVIALYNPKSGKRTEQILAAQRILLRHRAPETPVAIVRAAYRPGQAIQLSRLDAFADHPIGMLTTLLIGNASTYVQDGLMVTPRGYANKYQDLTGFARPGEKAGRSLSLGLEGWRDAIRAHWQGSPAVSPEELAALFATSVAEVLAIIGAKAPGISASASGGQPPTPDSQAPKPDLLGSAPDLPASNRDPLASAPDSPAPTPA